MVLSIFFFFSSRRRHTRCSRDWSSDVCSSDLAPFYDQAIPVGGAYVSTPKPDEALALIHQAIREIATLRFSGYSLGRFIDGYRFNYLVDNATAERQADFLARAELYLGRDRKSTRLNSSHGYISYAVFC